MKAGTKLQANGVEVSLYPDTVVQYAPHTEYIAYDLGGKQVNNLYAPTTLKVVKNELTDWHEVFFWGYGLTPKGEQKYTMLAMHDNDVSDLTKGKEFSQGSLIYTEGGFGPNGPKSYASHIHIQVCFGWTTTKVKNALGKWTLKDACPMNEVFFVNDTPIVTEGLKWEIFSPTVSPTITPTEETPVLVEETSPTVADNATVEPVVEQPLKDPEPIPAVSSPVDEQTPKVEEVIEPEIKIEPVVVSKSEIWLSVILRFIIELITNLLKRK